MNQKRSQTVRIIENAEKHFVLKGSKSDLNYLAYVFPENITFGDDDVQQSCENTTFDDDDEVHHSYDNTAFGDDHVHHIYENSIRR